MAGRKAAARPAGTAQERRGHAVITATAPGKAILLGEHAVVYGRPAIAVPVSHVRAAVQLESCPPGHGIDIVAADLGKSYRLDRTYADELAYPLQATVRNALDHLCIPAHDRHFRLEIRSQIPIARGMGSGTAVATALVRAIAQHYGRHLTSRAISDLVYQTEVLFHGTPSGVDNTVVAFEKPVYYVRDRQIDVFWVATPLPLLIADTGIPSRTRDTVAVVRQGWLQDRGRYNALFDDIGVGVDAAREAIATGELARLGMLMTRNHGLLQELGVSCRELDHLVDAALGAGALGAKLSGGGGGGCMIALVDAQRRADVQSALLLAGAEQVFSSTVR